MLKNPFGIRNGDPDDPIVISDLTEDERGLKCNCVCPECKGKLEAKMGDIKIHHFAHTKDPCDETLAFIKGLFMFIKQMISNEKKLYAPDLIISYSVPQPSISVTRNNIKEYVKIESSEMDSLRYYKYKSINGRYFNVDEIEFKRNSKNRIEALVVTSNDKKQLAIRILPPPNVCKQEKPSSYENFSTLVCDARDIDFYKNKKDEIFEKLKYNNRWYWLENKKVSEFYDEIIKEINKKQEWYQKIVSIMNRQNYTQKTEISNAISSFRYEKIETRNEIKVCDKIKEIYPNEDKNIVRKCRECGETKNISEFGTYSSGIDDGKGKCKSCFYRN